MKKVFAILCVLGIAYPYYYIFKFIETNDWKWSTSLFFEQINQNYAMSILNLKFGWLTFSLHTVLQFVLR